MDSYIVIGKLHDDVWFCSISKHLKLMNLPLSALPLTWHQPSLSFQAGYYGQIPRIKKAQRKKNLGTNPSFLHKGPKNGVEQEYDIHFGQILATKIRNNFLCSNLLFLP